MNDHYLLRITYTLAPHPFTRVQACLSSLVFSFISSDVWPNLTQKTHIFWVLFPILPLRICVTLGKVKKLELFFFFFFFLVKWRINKIISKVPSIWKILLFYDTVTSWQWHSRCHCHVNSSALFTPKCLFLLVGSTLLHFSSTLIEYL